MTTADTFPKLTLDSVLRVLMGTVAGWMAGTLLRQDVGQLLMRRLSDVREMWIRYQGGTLRRRIPRADGVVSALDAAAKAAAAGERVRVTPQRLPFQFGWLLKRMEYRASPCRVKLQGLLEQPEVGAFLEEYPSVARKLRPVCRACAVDTVLLRLPRKIRVVKPRKPRVRKPSYTDIEYRCGPDLDGRHWVLRLSRSGLRYKRL